MPWYYLCIYGAVAVYFALSAFSLIFNGISGFGQVFHPSLWWLDFRKNRSRVKIAIIAILAGALWPVEFCFFIGVLLYLAFIPSGESETYIPPEERHSILDTQGVI